MHNDLIGQFEGYQTAQEMWNALKLAFTGTSVTRLRALTLKFETYKMTPNAKLFDHLRKMSAMIRDLKAAGNNLSDEQQILAVLRSLPYSWDQMKLMMTHNESIKTFAQLSHHLELQVERQEAKCNASMFVAESSERKGSKSKRKKGEVRKDVELYEMVESDGVSTLSLSKGGDFNYQHGHDDPMSVEDSGSVPLNSQRGNDNPMVVEDTGRHVPHSGSIPLDSQSSKYTPIDDDSYEPRRRKSQRNDMGMIIATKEWLSSNFDMKDMGEANYVLGVKILRDRSNKILGLSQETYIRKIEVVIWTSVNPLQDMFG
ncbi:hypothetical protein RJ640_018752 [Escallonia rubra]|uniref:Polyprotein n=1 Tax=Escallonia rubra TaxID=112253 RepID=A0AA88RGW1_9ASTE|nr:hypothetical protein RJ640_018752 [Escallonia rubra]